MFYADGLTPTNLGGGDTILQIEINSNQQSLFVFDNCIRCNLGEGYGDGFVNEVRGINIPTNVTASQNLYQFCNQLNITGDCGESRYIECNTTNIRSANLSTLIQVVQSDIYELYSCNFMSGLNPNDISSYTSIQDSSNHNTIHVLGSAIVYQGIQRSTIFGTNSDWNFYRISDCNISNTSSITGATSGGEDFRHNIIESGAADNIDFTGATHVYQPTYGKTIYKRPDGTPRLRYFDNSDTLIITGPTS
jgi:hypothetical protein